MNPFVIKDQMNVYKVLVANKRKDGSTLKSDVMLEREKSPERAIEMAKLHARALYGFKGKVHILSVYVKSGPEKNAPYTLV